MIEVLTITDFVVLGLAAVLCLLIIISKDILTVLMSFLCVLFLVGISFLLFKSGFLFVTQILLYVGGVSVLFIFVIMLSKRVTKDKALISSNQNVIIGGVLSIGAAAMLLFTYKVKSIDDKSSIEIDDVKSLGKGIVTDYLISFELLAIFLLIALILAAVIAGKKQHT